VKRNAEIVALETSDFGISDIMTTLVPTIERRSRLGG
jgi:hypothetical protein